MRRMATEGVRRRWNDLPIRYKCALVVALPVVCLLFEIGWQLRVLKALDEAQQWTTHTQQVQLTVAELQQLLLGIESNDRGFGLSGNQEFLAPLARQQSDALAVAQRLTRLVEDNPEQSARARNLQELCRKKLNFARDVTAFFINHPLASQSARSPEFPLRLLESKTRMEEFTTLSRIFSEEEDRLLAERMARLKAQQQLSQRVLVLTIATGLGTGLFAAFLFSWSVAGRLTTLTTASRRISRGEVIPAPEAGRDEVSSLAWTLHSASLKINEQMQGLEALNRDLESFSYSVSNDLRSPLRHIHGFSKILQSDFAAELPDEAKRYLSRIEKGAERMGQLIDDLLNFSRIGRRDIDRQPVQLRPLVENFVEELGDSTGGRRIEWQIGPLPTVQGDAALIKQVFANLLGNAVKFSRTRERARIEVGTQHSQQGTAIFVRDNGVGFDMKFADKLFGVFQRLHRMEEFEGTGVGLATVARIVHKHGGTVWAESTLDQGATFYFVLGERVFESARPPVMEKSVEVSYAAAR